MHVIKSVKTVNMTSFLNFQQTQMQITSKGKKQSCKVESLNYTTTFLSWKVNSK